jgi:2-C-methyl-D-erythritol 4-phosphate cytidylyltransferase
VKSKTPFLARSFQAYPPPKPEAPTIYAVIPAGGVGRRMGADRPKQYLSVLGKKTMLELSARVLLDQPWISKVIVVVAADDPFQNAVQRILVKAYGEKVVFVLKAGATRRDTVLAGLLHVLADHPEKNRPWVLVHDAARPGLDLESLARLTTAVLEDPKKSGGLLALPVVDTVKRVVSAKSTISPRSAETLDRRLLWVAQTPQMFPLAKLCLALQTFSEVTDEASAMEQAGSKPLLVEGSRQNFKVTTNEDLSLMRRLLKPSRRTGR